MGEGDLEELALDSNRDPNRSTWRQGARWLPALLALALAFYCGTFAGAASAQGAAVAHAVLWLAWIVAGWLVGGAGWSGTWPWIGLVLAVGASWVQSPVPRAGATALVLLPTFLILPRLFAACWRGESGRRAARLGESGRLAARLGAALTVSAVSAWALWGWLAGGTDGASLPLGHHNLLAVFLVTLLPLAALEPGGSEGANGAWLRFGGHRLVAVAASALGVGALLVSRSLAGALALLAVLGAGAMTQRRRWSPRALLGTSAAAMVVLAAMAPRLLDVLRGVDPSTLARAAYWRAGWQGFLERPWLGWGPGSTAWTLHEYFQPIPGVHPADQVVADLHSLPLQLLYELGLVGSAVTVAVLAWSLWRLVRAEPVDRTLRRASLLGLLGAAVASAGGLPLSVPALPMALALAAGAVVAGAYPAPEATPPPGRWQRAAVAAVALAMAAWLVPVDLAHRAYERGSLDTAVSLDPEFPLYRWRLGLAAAEAEADDDGRALVFDAAHDAPGVSALWLSAGLHDAPGARSESSFHRACRTSRFGAVAPFRLAVDRERRGEPAAPVAARAVAAQPWLLAATDWTVALRTAAVARLAVEERIDPSWRSELQAAWQRARNAPLGESSRKLALDVDDVPATSLSLFAFRRLPRPVRLDLIDLDAALLAEVQHLQPASSLPSTDASWFDGAGCGLGTLP